MSDGLLERHLAFKAKKASKAPREAKVEKSHVESVEADGGVSLKFTSPGYAGVSDRIDLRPIPREHREIVARYFQFTEVKRPGKKPRPEQERFRARMQALGFKAVIVDQLKE